MIKRCIYHVPYPISDDASAASAIRPRKMLEAFQRNFDEVFVISGYGKERVQKFKQLKKRISEGIKYEFMYSENSTMPNLMTEKNHMPFYPFLERDIFRYCKKHNIPVGLFYRDIYWKFPVYKKKVNFLKRCIILPLYYYDLIIYNKYISVLYLPSGEMGKYVDFKGSKLPLPPGSGSKEEKKDIVEDKKNKQLELFYVGGIGGHYNVLKLIEGVRRCPFAHLTLCCHEDQWTQWKQENQVIIPSNVTIIHKEGVELEEYYQKADVGMLFFTASGYWKMAMPVKLFEYIEHLLPIIATKSGESGNFVDKNKAGWTINYNVKEFVQLLSELNENREIFSEKKQKLCEIAKENTWDARALFVYNNLKKVKEVEINGDFKQKRRK